MRLTATFAVLTVLAAVPAFGQSVDTTKPFGLDPYNPRDAAWLRDYGAALMTSMPLSALHALDPFNPTDAALLRQYGGAIPLTWFWPGGPWAPAMSGGPFLGNGLTPCAYEAGKESAKRATSTSGDIGAAHAEPASGPTSISTAIRPVSNDGIWISFGGRTWISAGRAVALQDTEFQRTGEYAGLPVYKRARVSDDVIYVPTREGMVAPYRLKR